MNGLDITTITAFSKLEPRGGRGALCISGWRIRVEVRKDLAHVLTTQYSHWTGYDEHERGRVHPQEQEDVRLITATMVRIEL